MSPALAVALAVGGGLVAGAAAAAAHVALVRRDVRRAVAARGLGPLLRGALLRLGLPVAALTACGVLGRGPGVASALVAFAVTQQLLRRRALREGAP